MSKIAVTYINHMGDDSSVVDAARVSYDKHSGRYSKEENNNLINYLAKHKHLSPFNHTFATFRVKAPIFVARQLVKHEYMPWNEVSGRYVVFKGEFYVPEQFRMSTKDKKQGSGEDASPELNAEFLSSFTEEQKRAIDSYNKCLRMGMAEEQARSRLPLDLMTEWIWSGTMGAFAKMCNLRCASDSQYESRIVANHISDVMGKLFPVSWKALTNG
jgi:thymidylate synthase (FAD)